ncbi:MAG: ABC transporter permease [Bacteroidota bacterium]
MNLLSLSLSYLRKRKLTTFLNVLLLAIGIATIVVLLLFSTQAEESLTKNGDGIDLVVGAKGSPLQLVLSSIYHLDVAPGNIPVDEAEALLRNPQIKSAIPLALGDNYRGYRIVGTTPAYVDHYGATLAEGDLWDRTLDAVIGHWVATEQGLTLGDELVTNHGFSMDGEAHSETPLRVVGILEPSGTVLDRLVLTAVESMWALHGSHPTGDGHDHDEDHAHHEDDDHAHDDEAVAEAPPASSGPGFPGMGAPQQSQRDYTSMLIQYNSPIAAAMFPRFVNSQTNLQAASPALETARLLTLLGVGLDAIRNFAYLLILASALGVFIALWNALQDRKYDLAVMRSLGASRMKLVAHVLLESLIMVSLGLILGLFLGHLATELLGQSLEQARQMSLTGWTWTPEEGQLVLLALGVGLVAAIIPAILAYRTDLARTLAVG